MQAIDAKWLKELGVNFTQLPFEGQQTLVDKTTAKLELRVGTVLANKLSDKQIAEFEKVLDEDGDTLSWLGRNYANYPVVVDAECKLLANEIRTSDDKIALITGWD